MSRRKWSGRHPALSSLVWPALLIIALGVVGAGQWLLEYPPQTSYVFTVHQPSHFAVGFLLLLIGASLFWWAVWRHRRTVIEPEAMRAQPKTGQHGVRPRALTLVSSLLSAVLFGYALVSMAIEGYQSIRGWLFLVAFLLAAVAFVAHDRGAGVRWWQPLQWWEAGFLALVAAVFIGINSFDLTSWYYSAIGDEYAFFGEARRIAEGGDFNPFSQAGVYGDQPVLSSAFQALAMRLFGVDHFGWKLSSVLAVALSFPFFYLLVSRLWGRSTGIFATVILASSHLLFGYAHTGYNNVQALPITLAAFWLFFIGHDRRSWFLVFAAAAMAGLGFYTIYMGRVAAVVLVMFALLVYRARPPGRLLVPGLIGGAFALAPLFVVNGWDVIGLMLNRSAVGYESAIVGDPVQRMLFNIPINLIAFNYNVQPHHYVTGSLLAPATAVLTVLGVGSLIAELPSRRTLFVVVWWSVGMVAIGVFSPYPYVAPSRIHYLVPCYALVAGLSLNYLVSAVDSLRLLPRQRWAVFCVAGGGALVLILGLNLYRFWEQSPPQAPIAVEAVAVRAVRSPICAGRPGTPLIAGGNPVLLRDIFGSYSSQPTPRLLSTEALLASASRESVAASCIVLLPPLEPAQSELATALQGDSRVWGNEFVTDYSGTRKVAVFFPQLP